MKLLKDFINCLNGTAVSDAMIAEMLDSIDGFRESRTRYFAALEELKADLGEIVEQIDIAIHRRFTAELLFAGYLGLQMNLDHFKNVMTPNCTWSQLDFNDYLREDLSHTLPKHTEADRILADFYQSLTEKQQEIYSHSIMDYDSFLSTFGPKLAHYYGYLLGNSLLIWLIPGYCQDAALTYKYNLMLENYFEKAFLPISI